MLDKSLSILVAGGAGFVGSHLCERLIAHGHRVVCLDNLQTGSRHNLRRLEAHDRFKFCTADITEPLPARVTRTRFHRIYNLACAASPPIYQRDPEHTMLTSVVGTDRLLRLAERDGARLLQASTSEVYGDPIAHPQVETDWGNVNCTGPRACYDEGKRAAEALCFDFERLGRAEVRVARIFNTYGPRLSAEDGRVVSNLISQALAGEDITVFGDGHQTRSFCFVADLVDGLTRLMEHPISPGGPVNLGNPEELTIRQLVAIVLDMTGSSSTVSYQRLPIDDPKRRRPDIGRAFELLGWRPTTSLADGLRATITWFDAAARPRPSHEPTELVA